MGAKRRTKFHETIETPEMFEEVISGADKKMAIFDVHQDWCGPCECMEANYQTIWFTLEEPENRISFWQCAESILPQEWRDKLKLDVRPRFLIFLNGELLSEIKGAKLTEIEKCIKNNLPELDD